MSANTGFEEYITIGQYLAGKRCVITGSGGTIGKTFAGFIASMGGTPIMVDIVEQPDTEAAVAAYGGQYSAHQVDISNVSQIKAFYAEVAEKHGGVDMLINNAGLLSEVSLLDMTEDNWDRVLNVNAKGAAFMSQGAVSLMQHGDGDRQIVNIVSLAALVGGLYVGAPYVCSKAALLGLSRNYAVQAGRQYGIRVNSISPVIVSGQMISDTPSEAIDGVKQLMKVWKEEIPPVHLLYAFEMICKTPSITGKNIVIDGGILLE
ncbi:MAG: SDR family oxidoreductase [Candidatus Latescibacteria bacterium]|nr:SDR family oxidoreductase [Candidatus Latescibacterota bacterium]